jgi:hypothetical protein
MRECFDVMMEDSVFIRGSLLYGEKAKRGNTETGRSDFPRIGKA